MLGQAETQEPELAHAGPGKHSPGFVSLSHTVSLASFLPFRNMLAYDLVDVRFNIFPRNFAVLFQQSSCVGFELGRQDVVIPWP